MVMTGLGGGADLQFGVDASQSFPPGDMDQNADCDDQAIELDPEDNLPPPIPQAPN